MEPHKPIESQGLLGGPEWALEESVAALSRLIADRDWVQAATQLGTIQAHLTLAIEQGTGADGRRSTQREVMPEGQGRAEGDGRATRREGE